VDEDNLVYLCLSHHNQYDAKSVQGKAVVAAELRQARDHLYQFLGPASERPLTFTLEIDRSFESFTEREQQRLIHLIKEAIGRSDDIQIVKRRRGSIKVDIQLEPEEALLLIAAIDSATFASQRIKKATISKILNSAFRAPSPDGQEAEPLSERTTNTCPPKGVSVLQIVSFTECRLRKVVYEQPVKESQVQDCYETLLLAADIPYSREKESFQYSSRAYRPDFVIAPVDLVVEIKLCTTPSRESDIIREINDDILAYRSKYGNLLFVVYDVGCIRDVDRFVQEFHEQEKVIIVVVKH
jgi:hypothetical protein